MKKVYFDSEKVEKLAKEKFCFPNYIMMENAAAALEKAVKKVKIPKGKEPFVVIVSGKGNNGGDGLALARRITGKIKCAVCLLKEPSSKEAAMQFISAKKVGVQFLKINDSGIVFPDFDFALSIRTINSLYYLIIVDCIFGTGFYGALNSSILELIETLNNLNGYKIACDIPSGIDKNGKIFSKDSRGNPAAFQADITITMGSLKTALFSDAAKNFTGKIKCAPLGINSDLFENCALPDAFLVEQSDINLPRRIKKAVHKGNFGHAVIVFGEKAGASIIAGFAALSFGAGFATIVGSGNTDDFKIPPDLMRSDYFPQNTSAILFGCGFGTSVKSFELMEKEIFPFIINMEKPACVLDADIFYYPKLEEIISALCTKNAKVILTPHPKELYSLLSLCGISGWKLQDVIESRFEAVKAFSEKYPKIVLVSKGAVTYIASNNKIFIFDKGCQALAKAGSGDVLAGLCVSLLAQNRSAEDAALTAVCAHGTASLHFKNNYSLTPMKLIEKLSHL